MNTLPWHLAPKHATHGIRAFNGATWLRHRNGEWERWDRAKKRWYRFAPIENPQERPCGGSL